MSLTCYDQNIDCAKYDLKTSCSTGFLGSTPFKDLCKRSCGACASKDLIKKFNYSKLAYN